MIYANENIYEGQWHESKRNGYGVMTKRNGDHFEGHWVNDLREGQGSYFYHDKNKLFVGEWVADQPKNGVYTEVDDDNAEKRPLKPHFMDKYILPPVNELKLQDPSAVLERAMERTKQDRAHFRVRHIPIEEMFTQQEYENLRIAFEAVSMGEAYVNLDSLKILFDRMMDQDRQPTEEQLEELLQTCGKSQEEEYVSFELFARAVALLLEENADKITTSSQQDGSLNQKQMEEQQYQDEYGGEGEYYGADGDYAENYEEGDEGVEMDDPYYNEYDVDQVTH